MGRFISTNDGLFSMILDFETTITSDSILKFEILKNYQHCFKENMHVSEKRRKIFYHYMLLGFLFDWFHNIYSWQIFQGCFWFRHEIIKLIEQTWLFFGGGRGRIEDEPLQNENAFIIRAWIPLSPIIQTSLHLFNCIKRNKLRQHLMHHLSLLE